MIRDVADSTDILCTSVHKILLQNLEMKKVCLKQVLRVLMSEQKKERVFIVQMFLNDCGVDPTLLWIITDDKLWVFEYNPSTKHQSVKRKSGEPQHRKAHMTRSQQKLMLVSFFDVLGVVMAEWVSYRKNVNAAFYIETLWKLRICNQKKRLELCGEPVCAPPRQRPQPSS